MCIRDSLKKSDSEEKKIDSQEKKSDSQETIDQTALRQAGAQGTIESQETFDFLLAPNNEDSQLLQRWPSSDSDDGFGVPSSRAPRITADDIRALREEKQEAKRLKTSLTKK